jgi:hypothetical protein
MWMRDCCAGLETVPDGESSEAFADPGANSMATGCRCTARTALRLTSDGFYGGGGSNRVAWSQDACRSFSSFSLQPKRDDPHAHQREQGDNANVSQATTNRGHQQGNG